MYLKRLELQGFKSFPEKIKLEFNKGITAVVGPNGSGKSNISDAVRWVLGEQSAKSLRGSKMEDIIFAGTDSRKPLSFAEVSMVIDNEDFTLQIEYSEVIVTRRVYRSGESEYSINGSICRLKDIHKLFMDTGIGKEGYSIIGQGRIDEILSSKSDERRYLFEEAAGIVKYRARRDETLVKLEKEKQNLSRVEDILDELANQLEPLGKQSAAAKEYLELREELKLLRINIFLVDSKRTEEKIKNLEEKLSTLETQSQNTLDAKTEFLKTIENLKAESSESEKLKDDLNRSLAELRSEFEQTENTIKLLNEKNNFLNQEIKRLINESDNRLKFCEEKNLDKINLERRFLEITTEISKTAEDAEKKETEYNEIKKRMYESESTVENFNTEIIELYRKESESKSYLDRLSAMYETLEERKEQLIEEMDFVGLNKSDLETQKENLILEEQDFENKLGMLKDEIDLCENEEKLLSQKLEDFERKISETDRKLSEAASRFNILKELEDDYEGYNKSIKAVLEKRKEDGFRGIKGAVGELLEVTQKFETAIEIALGFSVQNIVTETEDDAKSAIDYLKTSNKGRATFLPINIIEKKELRNKEEIVNFAGVLGIAKDLIKFEPIYENIFSNLLGRTVICDNLENAILLSRRYKNSFKIVTLQGDLMSVGGAMTGGSVAKKSTGIFSRGREIKALAANINSLTAEKNELANERAVISEEREILSEKYLNALELQKDYERKLQTLTLSINQLNEKLDSLNEKFGDLSLEDRQIMEQLVNTKGEMDTSAEKIKNINSEIESTKKALSDYQSTILLDKESSEESNKEITDLKVIVSQLNEKLSSIKQNIERVKDEIQNAEKIISRSEKEQNEKNQELESNKSKIAENKDKLTALSLEQKMQKKQLEKLSNTKENLTKEIIEKESEERRLIDEINRLEKEKTRLEVQKEQVEEDRRRLYDDIWEEYNITYQQALQYEKLDFGINELYKKEAKTKEKIKSLGDVYVGAIDEFKILKERFDFLTNQRNDIIESEDNLKSLIHELTELMSSRFSEQFKLISANFSKVFVEMFEGGRAHLKLLDESNVLESGIEIVAQPPGKKLQNMNLLSGGERALTATALLFAILKMKPSPFCILDEIEAALDDANVKRYADYLRNFSDGTQFIIITHRKGTMVVADVLYGVTMQEQGVSKLVSVSLEEYN